MKSLYEYTEKVEDLPEKKHGITKSFTASLCTGYIPQSGFLPAEVSYAGAAVSLPISFCRTKMDTGPATARHHPWFSVVLVLHCIIKGQPPDQV